MVGPARGLPHRGGHAALLGVTLAALLPLTHSTLLRALVTLDAAPPLARSPAQIAPVVPEGNIAKVAALAQGRPAPDDEAGKVERLLLDIDESVKKAGSDAEFVYATLFTYDQQLEASLVQEIDMVSEELTKLKAMQGKYQAQVGEAVSKLGQLGEAARESEQQASRYQAGTAKTNKDFDSILESVKMLVASLQHGTAEQTQGSPAEAAGHKPASPGELARVCRSVRLLLAQHQAVRRQFLDVFTAFLPPVALVQKDSTTGKLKQGPLRVHLTPALRARTIAALKTIQGRLRRQRSEALLQLNSWQQKLSGHATAVEATTRAQQGIQAEEEQKVEELAFSATFTEAVLKIDRDFHGKVRESVKRKAELVEAIRSSRQSQEKTLEALLDLLQGRYSVDDPAAPGRQGRGPAAFLQVALRSSTGGQQAKVSSLQYEIETAIRKKEDTHGILMRIKTMLDKSAPIDADSVQSVMTEFGGVLRSMGTEQSHAEEAKQRCESQAFHAGEEEQGLRANLALMDAVHNHTRAAIQAARYNLKGIMAKTKALQMSTEDFSKIVAKTTDTLEDQSRDRRTIMAAVDKAREIVLGRASNGPAASALLGEMLKELQAQEHGERAYRTTEVGFRGAFLAYARSYLQLLRERKGHYESSLSALELYADEVESDATAQADSLRSGGQLRKEGGELCEGILRFYARRSQQRLELSKQLRAVLPEVPAVLGTPLLAPELELAS